MKHQQNLGRLMKDNKSKYLPTMTKKVYAVQKPKKIIHSSIKELKSNLSSTLSTFFKRTNLTTIKNNTIDQNSSYTQTFPIKKVQFKDKKPLNKICRTQPSQNKNDFVLSDLKDYVTNVCNQELKCKPNDIEHKRSLEKEKRKRNKSFLISQLSVKEIQLEKIENQGKMLKKFAQIQGKTSSKKDIVNEFMKFRFEQQDKLVKMLFDMIKRINKTINEFQQIGYNRKTNKFVINYIKNNSKWMTRVFLSRSQSKKDILSGQIKWRVKSSEQIKQSFYKILSKQSQVMVRIELQKFSGYLENILIQKRLTQLDQVSNYIQGQLTKYQEEDEFKRRQGIFEDQPWKKHLMVGNKKEEKCDFSLDIYKLEQKFGTNLNVGEVNRKRHQELNKAYEKIQNFF